MDQCSNVDGPSREANNVALPFSSLSPGQRVPAKKTHLRQKTQPFQRLQAHRKLLNASSMSLTACEVLQLVLGGSSRSQDNTSTAEALLREFRTFGRVIKAPACKLMEVDGVGPAEVIALKVIETAVHHVLQKALRDAPIFHTNDSLRDYIIAKIGHYDIEVLHILYVDSENRLIGDEELWRGTIDRVSVHPREVIKRCLDLGAASFIIAHNHPDGHLFASPMDIGITERLVNAAAVFGIHVLDHVIVGNGEVLSLWTEGLMRKIGAAACS